MNKPYPSPYHAVKLLAFSKLKGATLLLVFISAFLLCNDVLLAQSDPERGLRIYYIRHAEGGHNVKQDWIDAGIPEDEWPDYVGDADQFTPLGLTQVVSATKKLQNTHFDFIGVSPLWRCRNTVLPYLKVIGSKGEIWPELRESYASSLIVSPNLPPPPTDPILGAGSLITLPPEETPYFIMREDGMYNFKLPDFPPDHADKQGETAAMKVVLQRVLDMIQERFAGSDTSILLVGHNSSGKGIVRMLTNDAMPGYPGLSNTGIWMVEEQPNGEFELKIFNDLPVINGELISDADLLPILEPGNTWYHNYFPFEFNAPVENSIEGSLITSESNPSTSENPGTLVSKFVCDSATQSSIRFKLPGNISVISKAIFKIRVYAPSEDSSGNNTLQLTLRKDDLEATQISLTQEIREYNKWVEYTFDMSGDTLQEDYYNDICLYFASTNDSKSSGNVYYFDAFQGPKKSYNVTFRVQDILADSLLQGISIFAEKRVKPTDQNGEVQFSLAEGNQSISIYHPDYIDQSITMEVSKDTIVQVSLTQSKKVVTFSIYSESSGNPLSSISVTLEDNEVITGLNGAAIFNFYKGMYEYAISHPDYITTSSSFELSNDTTIQISLLANRVNIKFRIYSEDKPLYKVALELEGDLQTTNQTGIALYEDLPRYEEYNWSASKEGYEDIGGTLSLDGDTTLNINMTLGTNTETFGLSSLKLYPNPSHSNIFIESDEKMERVDISDLRGALLYTEELKSSKATIDLSGYQNGIYIARIYREGLRTISLKVIKTL